MTGRSWLAAIARMMASSNALGRPDRPSSTVALDSRMVSSSSGASPVNFQPAMSAGSCA
jgi:hypothetical protein